MSSASPVAVYIFSLEVFNATGQTGTNWATSLIS